MRLLVIAFTLPYEFAMSQLGRYRMSTIARLTGFSPAVLRAWEQRHALLEPVRTEGGHRLYTECDLQVLRRVRSLIDEGRTIGEIAQFGRDGLLGTVCVPPVSEPVWETPPGVDGQLDRLRAALVAAACNIDQTAMERALDEAFILVSADVAIHQILQPAARRIGELWMQGQCSVAGEHMASSSMGHRLRKFVETARPAAGSAPRVVCACFPDENHELGLLIVAYHLGRLGYHVTYLGSALPLVDLESACQSVEPRAVFLSVMRRPLFEIHFPHVRDFVRRQRRNTLFFVGGCGVPPNEENLDSNIRFWNSERPLNELGTALHSTGPMEIIANGTAAPVGR